MSLKSAVKELKGNKCSMMEQNQLDVTLFVELLHYSRLASSSLSAPIRSFSLFRLHNMHNKTTWSPPPSLPCATDFPPTFRFIVLKFEAEAIYLYDVFIPLFPIFYYVIHYPLSFLHFISYPLFFLFYNT